jgi:nucleoside-diphosphate-sugar epimerase
MGTASNKRRALITGAEGFTGKYLIDKLSSAGYEVYGTAYYGLAKGQNIFELDLCNQSNVRDVVNDIRPDLVAHLAGISFVASGDASRIYNTNILGSLNLLEALGGLAKAPNSVLLASSAVVYGNSTIPILNEDLLPEPNNDYAVSKYSMEKIAKLWMNRLPIFIVRPFNYTGVGQEDHFLIPKIVKHFRDKQKVIELGNLEVWREFGDVRFVTEAYKNLLELSPTGATLNICTGQAHSLREVIDLCQEITGHHIEIQVNPKFVRENEIRVLKGDNTRLKSLIGNSHLQSIRDTLTWMLNETPPFKT